MIRRATLDGGIPTEVVPGDLVIVDPAMYICGEPDWPGPFENERRSVVGGKSFATCSLPPSLRAAVIPREALRERIRKRRTPAGRLLTAGVPRSWRFRPPRTGHPVLARVVTAAVVATALLVTFAFWPQHELPDTEVESTAAQDLVEESARIAPAASHEISHQTGSRLTSLAYEGERLSVSALVPYPLQSLRDLLAERSFRLESFRAQMTASGRTAVSYSGHVGEEKRSAEAEEWSEQGAPLTLLIRHLDDIQGDARLELIEVEPATRTATLAIRALPERLRRWVSQFPSDVFAHSVSLEATQLEAAESEVRVRIVADWSGERQPGETIIAWSPGAWTDAQGTSGHLAACAEQVAIPSGRADAPASGARPPDSEAAFGFGAVAGVITAGGKRLVVRGAGTAWMVREQAEEEGSP